jgi:hypothetical protein
LIGGSWSHRYDRSGMLPAGDSWMEWTLRLVGTGMDGQSRSCDVMVISRPDDLGQITNVGLTLAEAKQLLAQIQQKVVDGQANHHAMVRPDCRSCGGRYHTKGWRPHRIATLFGEVRVRLPRLACAGCGCGESGLRWPSHCRSTPELNQLQARLSALMPFRVAADVLQHLLPIDAGTSPETLRSHTLQVGKQLGGRETADHRRGNHHQLGLDLHPQLRRRRAPQPLMRSTNLPSGKVGKPEKPSKKRSKLSSRK